MPADGEIVQRGVQSGGQKRRGSVEEVRKRGEQSAVGWLEQS